MTVGEALSDIRGRLGLNSDDHQMDRFILARMSLAFLRFIGDHLSNGGEITPKMMVRYDCQAKKEESTTCKDCTDSYVDLPIDAADIENGAGILLILGNEYYSNFSSATDYYVSKRSRFFNKMRGFYRVASKLYLTGGLPMDPQFTLYVVPASLLSLDDEDIFPATDTALDLILERTEQICRKELATPEDRKNDGQEALKG